MINETIIDNVSNVINGTINVVEVGGLYTILKSVIGVLGGVTGVYIILTVLRWYEFKKIKDIIKDLNEEIKEMKELIKEEQTIVEDIKNVKKITVKVEDDENLHQKR